MDRYITPLVLEHRILLIWDRFGDYHRARWSALGEIVGPHRVFGADLGGADKLYHWHSNQPTARYCQLSDKPVEEADADRRFTNFKRFVKANNITAICLGYGRKEYRRFALYAKTRGIKVVIFSESWYPRDYLFDAVKGLTLCLLADGFLLSGQRTFDHFTQRLRIASDKIRLGYSSVDNAHFYRKRSSPVKENVVLCVARYSDVKNLGLLIRAFVNSHLGESWELNLVGAGPLQAELTAFTSRFSSVTLSNWASYDDLPACYHRAKLLVLPSKFEPWGLVVNEAMAAELPVIVSKEVGAAPDLVSSQNGATFHADDEGALTEIFNRYADMNEEALNRQGRLSYELVRQYSPTHWARNLVELIER